MTTGEVPTTGEVLPLTYDQLATLRTGPDATVSQYLELDGPLDEDRLCQALRQTLAECGCLHTTFVLDGPEPGQIAGAAPAGPDVVDATETDNPQHFVRAWIDGELARPMDVTTGPLYMHVLFRLPHGRYGWFQRCHRLVNDEPGMTAIVRRIAETYEPEDTGAPPASWPFVTPTVPLTSDARYRESDAWPEDRRYWEHLLAGAPDRQAPAGPVAAGENTRRVTVPADGRLLRLARRSGGGAAAVLLAALAVYWQSLTDVDDVVLGHRDHGTTTPVRCSLTPQLTFDALTRQIGLQLRRSRRHRFLAASDSGPADLWSVAGGIREPLGVERLGEGAVAVVEQWDAHGDDAFGVTVSVAVDERDGTWAVDLQGPGDAQRFARVLAAVVGAPDVPLVGVDLLGVVERGVLVPVRGGVG
ncbi:MAG: non-ribosomal peptide synthetase, partial [Rhodococcus sp. (in: high G+C Gram-positive bacteria)]